jgi:hypothetical protein
MASQSFSSAAIQYRSYDYNLSANILSQLRSYGIKIARLRSSTKALFGKNNFDPRLFEIIRVKIIGLF